jgi:hypothetical protein
MKLTDGKQEVEISKNDMEIILERLHDARLEQTCFYEMSPDDPLIILIQKLEQLDG